MLLNFNQYGVTASDYKWHLYVISKCEKKKKDSVLLNNFQASADMWIELSWAKGPEIILYGSEGQSRV